MSKQSTSPKPELVGEFRNIIATNIAWLNQTTSTPRIITHRQVDSTSGKTYIQALVTDLRPSANKIHWEDKWIYPFIKPKIYARSTWQTTTDLALTDLLAVTEDMVGKFLREQKFYDAEAIQLDLGLKFDEFPVEKKVPAVNAEPRAHGAAGEENSVQTDSEEAEWHGCFSESGSASSDDACTCTTSASSSGSLITTQTLLKEEKKPKKYSSPTSQHKPPTYPRPATPEKIRMAPTRNQRQGKVVTLHIPNPELPTADEVTELVKKVAGELIETDGRRVAREETQKQVKKMFGRFAGLDRKQRN